VTWLQDGGASLPLGGEAEQEEPEPLEEEEEEEEVEMDAVKSVPSTATKSTAAQSGKKPASESKPRGRCLRPSVVLHIIRLGAGGSIAAKNNTVCYSRLSMHFSLYAPG
jgi:hypothetical protein